MFIILFLIYLITSSSSIQATPLYTLTTTAGPGLHNRDQSLPDLSTSGYSSTSCGCSSSRSTWSIVWSCLATIFACTWVAIHPNSAGKCDEKQRPLLRRVELMIWSILTPEMIIYWALRQWVGARRLARQYKSFGWTMTHGHFLQMGGFMLADADHDLLIVSPEAFQYHLTHGIIQFPKITAEEIHALSKGDGLSKVIVVTQTVWFIVQCLARAAQGLAVTEIELVTVAFAFLNGLMYFLWWDKPLDANFVVRLYRCSTRIPVEVPHFGAIRSPGASSPTPSAIVFNRTIVDEDSECHYLNEPQDASCYSNAGFGCGSFECTSCSTGSGSTSSLENTSSNSNGEMGETRETDSNDSAISVQERVQSVTRDRNTDLDSHLSSEEPKLQDILPPDNPNTCNKNAIEVHANSATKQFWLWPSADIIPNPLSYLHFSPTYIWKTIDEMRGFGRSADDQFHFGIMRVPTFWAAVDLPHETKLSEVLGTLTALIGVVFGAIHCTGWNFVFPSHTESIIWRIASLVILGLPLTVIMTFSPLHHFLFNTKDTKPVLLLNPLVMNTVIAMLFIWRIFVKSLPIYLLARITLIVEAVISLRHLPPGAFVELEWNKFVPHI